MAKAYNIKWETDGYDVHLPYEVELPNGMNELDIADFLSDEYGFLVESFDIWE